MSKTTQIVIGVLIAAAAVFGITKWAQASECSFTRDLSVGATGADVTCLQQTLLSGGFAIPALTSGATPGYFGAQTRAAVSAWQSAHNIAPAVGYFGPISRSVWNAASAPTPPTAPKPADPTPAAPTLEGTDGTISDVTVLGQYNDEEISEGKSVKVLGAEIEASNDGDIALKSVKISLDPSGNTGSDNLDDYIDSVSVFVGNAKVGRADVKAFSQDDNDVYSKTITLNGENIVRSDEAVKLYVSLDAVSNIDSADISGDSWTVNIENVRFVDGSGVVTTDDSTGDIGNMDVPFDFVDFGTAADTELKISLASDSPDAGIVLVDEDSSTDGVSLLKGKLKLTGSADIVIEEFPVTLTVTGATDVDAVTNSLTLILDGEEYTETVNTSSASESVVFENLDYTMSHGDTITFEVLADVNDIDAGAFDEGDTLKASVTSSNRNDIDVENEEGDQLFSSEKSGTAVGEEQEFRTNGIALTLVSASTQITSGNSSNDDQATFTLRFKVSAVGDDVYVSSLADAVLSGVTAGSTSVIVDRAGSPTTGGTSVVLVNDTDDDLTLAGNYLIEEDASETFTLTVTAQLPAAGSAGLYRASLSGVSWDTSDVSPTNAYTSNLDSFKTSYVGLN